MVTLRPDHPSPIAVARVVQDLRNTFFRSLTVTRQPGIHRALISRPVYRSSHQDIERSSLARFLPAWRYRVGPPVIQVSDAILIPPVAGPVGPIDPVSKPVPDTVGEMRVSDPAPVADRRATSRPPSGNGKALRGISRDGSPTETLTRSWKPSRPAMLPRSRYSPAAVFELKRTQILPIAHPLDGSNLASLLGFGEQEASFVGYRPDRGRSSPSSESLDDPWRELPTLSMVASELDRPGNTGDAVKLLWEATAEMDVYSSAVLTGEVAPVEMEFRSSRRIRWSVVLSTLVLVALVATTVKIITDLPERQAEAIEVQYGSAARRLSGSLTSLEQTLVEDGLNSGSGLSILTGHLSTLDSSARKAETLASQQLPSTPIVGTSDAVEGLVVPRQLLESASMHSLQVGQRLGYAMAYSLTLSETLELPQLPSEASLNEADAIAEQLSLSIAEMSVSLSELPDDAFFQDFRGQAPEVLGSIEVNQASYIAALRSGNSTAATNAAASMGASVNSLRDDVRLPLDNARTWALGEIHRIRESVSRVESLIAL